MIELTGKIFHTIWDYNLVNVAGNNIKISNLVLSITLFLFGLKYSQNFSNLVRNYLKIKIKDDKDAVNALEKIIIYISLLFFAMTILQIANVPLSSFAFIGGALAIGVGLGAQTLIGNFISSLIIMIERPMKIGDIVEIEGVTGRVSSIGARCVVLTTFSNIEVLVPNNKIMHNSLANWTSSNKAIKYQLELVVPREVGLQFNPEAFIEELEKILAKLNFAAKGLKPTVYLTKIEEDNFTFLLNLCCDLAKMKDPEQVKNSLNLLLLNNLGKHHFTVKYLTLVDSKPILMREEKKN